ncbi:hypothetical protein ACP3T3_01445 [Chryseobacterium sp. CBSDS_008]|uniref:hypothetical protein n=1 Tax=Chryseobacterium sp. CBSDS_008 TaxID=3415265 RepID=UPI003CEB6398
MNNNFSISRYKTLSTIDWKTNNKTYLFIALAMIVYWILYGLSAIWVQLHQQRDIFTNMSAIRFAFNIQMLGFICFIASNTFSQLSSNMGTASYFLLLPCTVQEKFTAKFVMSGIVFWCIFYLSVFLGLAILWYIFYPIALANDPSGLLINRSFDIYLNVKILSNTVSLFIHAFLYHSFFMLGATVFKQFKFIKSMLPLILYYTVLTLFRFDIMFNVPYLIICGMLTIGCWFLAYQRLKKYTL